MKCYRESTCAVRLHGEGACRLRFEYSKCPNDSGDDADAEMLEQPNGGMSDE